VHQLRIITVEFDRLRRVQYLFEPSQPNVPTRDHVLRVSAQIVTPHRGTVLKMPRYATKSWLTPCVLSSDNSLRKYERTLVRLALPRCDPGGGRLSYKMSYKIHLSCNALINSHLQHTCSHAAPFHGGDTGSETGKETSRFFETKEQAEDFIQEHHKAGSVQLAD
jgi:hypothetical protein